ncbi:hypothetical protein [Nocardioides xinjiangensis]|uniref:hypothetical protein n=1 Tax=Nocardioides xinjiangensis TaxID=2817376 RepID=UPI001FEFBE69|nr:MULTISPECIES: hypothetical protein [unclassified Nocardioides]
MTRTTVGARLALTGAGALLLAACAGSQDAPARSAAQQLLRAVDTGDGSAACALLAPAARDELEQQSGRPCERAVLQEDLGSGSGAAHVEVYDSMAQVRLGADTVFLSRFDGRWLVVGAACTPVAGRPYDCSVAVP